MEIYLCLCRRTEVNFLSFRLPASPFQTSTVNNQNRSEFMHVWSVFSELMPFGIGSVAELMSIGMGCLPELVPIGMDTD